MNADEERLSWTMSLEAAAVVYDVAIVKFEDDEEEVLETTLSE
jgi:hypothetical protein